MPRWRREGSLAGNRKDFREKGKLPPVTVLEITGRDDDGDLIGKPVTWDAADGERPSVLVLARGEREGTEDAQIGVGDKILARITRLEEPDVEGLLYEGEAIKRLPRDQRRLLGIFRAHARGGGTIEPIDRKALEGMVRPHG